MCGRYVVARAIGDLVADADAVLSAQLEGQELRPSWNIAPTTNVPIVLERLEDDELHREMHVARWGLVPVWAKDVKIGSRAFNARSETVTQKPMFRSAVKARRCAVPADGYYEWKKLTGGKQPYYVHPVGGEPIYFAGLYEWWKDPEVEDGTDGQWMLSTTILTMPAPPADAGGVLTELSALHDRLPIPMSKETMSEWLNPDIDDPAADVDALRGQAYAVAAEWQLDPVGSAVGNVRNNGPELIEPQG